MGAGRWEQVDGNIGGCLGPNSEEMEDAFCLPSGHNFPGKPGRNALGKRFNNARKGKTAINL